MEINVFLREKLLNDVLKAKEHFIRAAQIVSDECDEQECKEFRRAADGPAQKLQELIDALQV